MRILFCLTIILCTCTRLTAQNAFVDSLENKLNHTETSISEKFAISSMLVERLRSERLYDRATEINKKLIVLAKKEENYTELTKAYVYQGIILNNLEDYKKVVFYIDSAQVISSRIKDKIAAAYARYLMAYQAQSLGENKKAMVYSLEGLSFLDQTDGDFNLEFKLNYIPYGIYTEWNDLDNTLKYAKKLVETAQKSGNKNNLSNAYSAMTVAYTYIYESTKQANDLKMLLDYSEKAAVLYKEFPGQVAGFTYALARNNKASYLMDYSPKITADIRKQIEFNINESLSISQNIFGTKSLQAGSYGMLSKLANQDGDVRKAEQYLLKAYTILLTETPVYYHIMIRVVSDLSVLYEQKGDLVKALEFERKATEYRGKLFNEQEAETVKKLEAQYQSEKKEKEVQTLREKAKAHKKQNYLFTGLIVISAIGAFFMFRSYHFNLRYSLAREKQLDAEKQEAELQVKLGKEEKARLRAEQELMIFQQQQLQDEVMANQLHIQHKNEVLQQLKVRLEDDKPLNINQIIREENLLDNDFENAKFQIQEIHPNFFKVLSENVGQKLTSLDLKYCAYLYLGMDTKQIANLLNVEPKSVRMTKYRLKQKFALDSETDLVNYLKKLG